jgi:hypothetical protein
LDIPQSKAVEEHETEEHETEEHETEEHEVREPKNVGSLGGV